MAGVPDNRLRRAGPWPLGVDNLSKEGDLVTDEFGRIIALREAVNVDLTDTGLPRRRRGRTAVRQVVLGHSLWSDHRLPFGLFVDDGALHAIHPDLSTQALGVTVGNLPVSYALINDRVFFSNTTTSGLITPDMQAWSWAPEQPSGQPLLTAVAGYSLPPGQYQVVVTFTDALGRESGSSLAASVDVAAGHGIDLSSIPQPTDVVATPTTNVYCTGANDQVFRLYAAMPSGMSTGVISARAEGRPLQSHLLRALPPGQIVRGGHGRQWVASNDTLFWSEPLRYGMYRPSSNRMRFNARIDLVEPVGDGEAGAGVYVAAGDVTYWFAGSDPAKFSQAVAARTGAVPGSSARAPASAFGDDNDELVTVWLGRNGTFYRGAPGGGARVLNKTGAADTADGAAVLYREDRGMSHLVAALRGAQSQHFAVTDRAYAHVVHRDAP